MQKIAYDGEMIPRFYGIAWREWNTYHRICYPIPFHLIIGFCRFIYIRISIFTFPNDYLEAYRRGYRDGMKEGHKHVW